MQQKAHLQAVVQLGNNNVIGKLTQHPDMMNKVIEPMQINGA